MLRAAVIGLLLLVNTLTWGSIVLLGGVVKLLTFGRLRHAFIHALTWFAFRWVQCNDAMFDALLSTRWHISGFDGLRADGRYLMICNHITWVDIFAVLRAIRSGGAPFIRFFIKRNLLWLPIVGQACAALEFPFMRRYTTEYLKRYPEKRGRDLETTRKACQRYQHVPVTVANFLEGTRFTRQKHASQQSPYQHLLRPRMGGLAFVLASLGDQLDAVIDVTLVYPRNDVTLLDFVSNRVPWIAVSARRIEVPREFLSAQITGPGPVRERFKEWVDELWRAKDQEISRILLESGK